MAQFLAVWTHDAPQCPIFNENSKKIMSEAMSQLPTLAKSHGIKVLGMWTAESNHTVYQVFDAPSVEELLKFSREPALYKVESISSASVTPVEPFEDRVRQLK